MSDWVLLFAADESCHMYVWIRKHHILWCSYKRPSAALGVYICKYTQCIYIYIYEYICTHIYIFRHRDTKGNMNNKTRHIHHTHMALLHSCDRALTVCMNKEAPENVFQVRTSDTMSNDPDVTLSWHAVNWNVFYFIAVCFSVLHCVAVYCSVLQYVVVCCGDLEWRSRAEITPMWPSVDTLPGVVRNRAPTLGKRAM